MFVVKRDGRKEAVKFDNVTARIQKLAFGFKTLEKSYLMKTNGKVAERPQHMIMRVSVGIHKEDIEAAIETYNLMSERWFTHATPTLFNSGTPKPQLSSCFLLMLEDDSI